MTELEHFGRVAPAQLGLDLLDGPLDGLGADRALGARHLQTAAQLVGVPLLAAVVALDDHQRRGLRALVGGEAMQAGAALAPAARGRRVGGVALVEHARIWRATHGAAHAPIITARCARATCLQSQTHVWRLRFASTRQPAGRRGRGRQELDAHRVRRRHGHRRRGRQVPRSRAARRRPGRVRLRLRRRAARQSARHPLHPRPRGPHRRAAVPDHAARPARSDSDLRHAADARADLGQAQGARHARARHPVRASAKASTPSSVRSTSSRSRSTTAFPTPSAWSSAPRRARVFHTGDFKFDPTPVEGKTTDNERLRELGDEGVLVLLSDCVRVEQAGWTASESGVRDALEQLIDKAPGRVLVTTFASNLGRLREVVRSAHKLGRKTGDRRPQHGGEPAASRASSGFMDIPEGSLVELREMNELPPDKVVHAVDGQPGRADQRAQPHRARRPSAGQNPGQRHGHLQRQPGAGQRGVRRALDRQSVPARRARHLSGDRPARARAAATPAARS